MRLGLTPLFEVDNSLTATLLVQQQPGVNPICSKAWGGRGRPGSIQTIGRKVTYRRSDDEDSQLTVGMGLQKRQGVFQ